jgi:uncharacterized membrane protein YeaQ/YmgE (transglycosylase-associated protein family)
MHHIGLFVSTRIQTLGISNLWRMTPQTGSSQWRCFMMTMIGHAFMGLIVGLVARAVLPGRQHMGLILTMLLGMVGAWLGGLIGRVTGMYEEGRPAGFVMAVVGAVVVLLIYVFATRSATAVLLPLAYR